MFTAYCIKNVSKNIPMVSTLQQQQNHTNLDTVLHGLDTGAINIEETARLIGLAIDRLKAGNDDFKAGQDTAFTRRELCTIVQAAPGLSEVTTHTKRLTRGTTPLGDMLLRISLHIRYKRKNLRGLAALLGKYCILLCERCECPFSYLTICDGKVEFHDEPVSVYSLTRPLRSELTQTEPWIFMHPVPAKTGVVRVPADDEAPVPMTAEMRAAMHEMSEMSTEMSAEMTGAIAALISAVIGTEMSSEMSAEMSAEMTAAMAEMSADDHVRPRRSPRPRRSRRSQAITSDHAEKTVIVVVLPESEKESSDDPATVMPPPAKRMISPTVPYTEETVRLAEANKQPSYRPHVFTLEDMPSDELLQAMLIIASLHGIQASFEVSGDSIDI